MTNAARTKTINELKAAMASSEAKLAALPAAIFVIEWHESILKTDGDKVALCGSSLYTGKATMMIQEAAKFTRSALASGADGVAVAMPAGKALSRMTVRHAEMLAMLGE